MNKRIDAEPNTVHWGYFDASLSPLVTVESGETITISTVSGGEDVLPGSSFSVPETLRAIQKELAFDDERVSSSRIREALADGDFSLVERLLGRRPSRSTASASSGTSRR